MRASVQTDVRGAQNGDVPGASKDTAVLRLRAQLERVQGRRMDASIIPTHPALADLLPGGGLRAGSAYSIAPSASLLLALLARPSQEGSWCGVVGMPELGAEAAEQIGVDLSRLVLIPDPGPRWLAVTATVAEVLPVVAVRPSGRAGDADVSRLAARLRDRGAVLLVQGVWPQAEAALEVSDPEWTGLGSGYGYLTRRELTVTVHSRRSPVPRRARMVLPDAAGALDLAAATRSLNDISTRAERSLSAGLRDPRSLTDRSETKRPTPHATPTPRSLSDHPDPRSLTDRSETKRPDDAFDIESLSIRAVS